MFDYSVVIPAHNEALWIVGAIQSALNQSLPAREIIVVDDGSSDQTSEAAGAMPRVKIIKHDRCCGLSQARNSGIAAASGKWIAFLDADDRWHRHKLLQQAELAESTGCGLIYCGARVISDSHPIEIHAQTYNSHRDLCRQLLLRNCITGSASAAVVSKKLLDESGGFDTTLTCGEDWDMWLKLAGRTRFAAVEEPLVDILKRTDGLGACPAKIFNAAMTVLHKNDHLFSSFADSFLLRRRARARAYERRAVGYLMQGQLSLAKRDLISSTAIWPFRLHTLVPLLKLYLGMVQPEKQPEDSEVENAG